MKKKPCPREFVEVGAASVFLKHAIEAGDDAVPLFDALWAAVDKATPVLKAHGIDNVLVARGKIDMVMARRCYDAGDRVLASLYEQAGHGEWSKVISAFGFATPTDPDIQDVHREQLQIARASRAVISSEPILEQLAARGDAR